MFSGDLLFAGSIGRSDSIGGDPVAMQKSLAWALTLPDETVVLPGHGRSTTIGRERASNPHLRGIESAARQVSAINAPKGVMEYLPPESAAFLAVRDALAAPAIAAGYGYIEMATFEHTELFVRGVGESTDVVSKEMYTFDDRGGRSLSLRPEGTAGVMRAVIEHRLDRGALPVKLWYAGPFFRAEAPQLGRYRQFFQVGVEAIGVDDPALDAEVIAIGDDGFRSLGLTDYTLDITSLGDETCRPAYRERAGRVSRHPRPRRGDPCSRAGEPAAGARRQAHRGPSPAR